MSNNRGPVCPSCGADIESMDLKKSFIFVDGLRVSAGLSWVPGCCSVILVDEDFGFDTTPLYDADGNVIKVRSVLLDPQGVEIMSWWDDAPEECSCDEEFDED